MARRPLAALCAAAAALRTSYEPEHPFPVGRYEVPGPSNSANPLRQTSAPRKPLILSNVTDKIIINDEVFGAGTGIELQKCFKMSNYGDARRRGGKDKSRENRVKVCGVQLKVLGYQNWCPDSSKLFTGEMPRRFQVGMCSPENDPQGDVCQVIDGTSDYEVSQSTHFMVITCVSEPGWVPVKPRPSKTNGTNGTNGTNATNATNATSKSSQLANITNGTNETVRNDWDPYWVVGKVAENKSAPYNKSVAVSSGGPMPTYEGPQPKTNIMPNTSNSMSVEPQVREFAPNARRAMLKGNTGT